MACVKFNHGQMSGIICGSEKFKAGDKPPEGYIARQEWWEVQHKAGLRQRICGCRKWIFPQEEEDHRGAGKHP